MGTNMSPATKQSLPTVDQMTHLIALDPAKAKAILLGVIEQAHGRQNEAKDILGCRYQTVTEWINRLKIRREVEAIRKKAKDEGTWHRGERGDWSDAERQARRAKKAARQRVLDANKDELDRAYARIAKKYPKASGTGSMWNRDERLARGERKEARDRILKRHAAELDKVYAAIDARLAKA